MSLTRKMLVFAFGAVLVLLVGRGLTTTTLQNVVGAMASAVWGS